MCAAALSPRKTSLTTCRRPAPVKSPLILTWNSRTKFFLNSYRPKEAAMTPEDIRILFENNTWANHRALDAAAQLVDVQFVKPLGSSFPSLRDTMVHICGGEWIWNERFHGKSPSAIPDFAHIQTAAA